jgi:hypothetical protein
VPLMQAWPWQTAGSTVILSRHSIACLACKTDFSMRKGAAKYNWPECATKRETGLILW